MFTQVFPLSLLLKRYGLKSSRFKLLNETKITFSLNLEVYTSLTKVFLGTPGKLSYFPQVFPPSEVIWTQPSSVPTTNRFSFFRDSSNETMVPTCEVDTSLATASILQYLSITGHWLRSSCAVKSPEMVSQPEPRSLLRNNLFAP